MYLQIFYDGILKVADGKIIQIRKSGADPDPHDINISLVRHAFTANSRAFSPLAFLPSWILNPDPDSLTH
jgi:hypothetical protein